MNYKGILFDFDGVLAKTMEDNFNAWYSALSDFGYELKPDDYFPLEGTGVRKLGEIFAERAGLDISKASEIASKKESYYIQNHKFEFYPGVEDFIEILYKKKIPKAIVSAALSGRLKKTVPENFLAKFEAVISSDMVEFGKPAPDSYLKAAQILNLSPDECIVVENAPMGIMAAKRANSYCIAICSTLKKDMLKDADVIIDEFKDLNDLLVIKNMIS